MLVVEAEELASNATDASSPDRQVAGDPEVVRADLLDEVDRNGRSPGSVDVEEVGGSQMAVTRAVAGDRLAVAMRISAVELVGLASSRWSVPSTSLNLPRTVVTIMCLAEKRRSVWAASIVQSVSVPVRRRRGWASSRVSVS